MDAGPFGCWNESLVLKQHLPILLSNGGVFAADPHRGFRRPMDDRGVHCRRDQIPHIVSDPHGGGDDRAHDAIRLDAGHGTHIIEVDPRLMLEG